MKYLVHNAAALILELDHDFHHQIDVTKELPASLPPSPDDVSYSKLKTLRSFPNHSDMRNLKTNEFSNFLVAIGFL